MNSPQIDYEQSCTTPNSEHEMFYGTQDMTIDQLLLATQIVHASKKVVPLRSW